MFTGLKEHFGICEPFVAPEEVVYKLISELWASADVAQQLICNVGYVGATIGKAVQWVRISWHLCSAGSLVSCITKYLKVGSMKVKLPIQKCGFRSKWMFDKWSNFLETADMSCWQVMAKAKPAEFLYLFGQGKRNTFTQAHRPENHLMVSPRQHKHAVQFRDNLSVDVDCSFFLSCMMYFVSSPVLQPVLLHGWTSTHTLFCQRGPQSRVNTPAAAHSGHGQSHALD